MARGLWVLRLALLVGFVGLCRGGTLVRAQTAQTAPAALPVLTPALHADLSSYLVAISAGFTGAEVVLFGVTDAPGDIVVRVTGPSAPLVVRRKEQVAGLWINRRSLRFESVPGYYGVAASRPDILEVHPRLAARLQLGTAHLRLDTVSEVPDAETKALFRDALIRNKQAQGLFPARVGEVTVFRNNQSRLFRTNLRFPAMVPTGKYTVETLVLNQGEIVKADSHTLSVSKIGISAEIFEFSRLNGIIYGLAAVIGALAIGWGGALLFRR